MVLGARVPQAVGCGHKKKNPTSHMVEQKKGKQLAVLGISTTEDAGQKGRKNGN